MQAACSAERFDFGSVGRREEFWGVVMGERSSRMPELADGGDGSDDWTGSIGWPHGFQRCIARHGLIEIALRLGGSAGVRDCLATSGHKRSR